METEIDMGWDNEIIRSVRRDADLKLEAVAAHTGCSTSAINRYEIDGVSIPVRYVKGLHDLTRDFRLHQLIDPGCHLVPGNMVVRIPPVTPLDELLPKVLAEIKRFGLLAETVERIVRDGRVDESDDTAIDALFDLSNKLTARMIETNRSIVAHREAACRSGLQPRP